ncbi:hypothetical protein [Enterococcus olivae]
MVNRVEILQHQCETLDWREIYREVEQTKVEQEIEECHKRVVLRLGYNPWETAQKRLTPTKKISRKQIYL